MKAILSKGLVIALLYITGVPMWWLMLAGFTLLLCPYGEHKSWFSNLCIYLVVGLMWWLVLPTLCLNYNHETAK